MVTAEWEVAPPGQDVARLREAVEAFRRRPKTGRTQEQISHELSQVRVICDVIELEFSDLASESLPPTNTTNRASTARSPGSSRFATCRAGPPAIAFAPAISCSDWEKAQTRWLWVRSALPTSR